MRIRNISYLSLLISLLVITPLVSSENILIRNVGITGFNETNQEFTPLKTVVLELNYSADSICRYKNENSEWSRFENCVFQKYWVLSDSSGLKTVSVNMNLTNGSSIILNDTIYYNFTGAGLDLSAPSRVTITNDIYSNNYSFVSYAWSSSIDAESNLLKIPLIYSYQILRNDTVIVNWTHNGVLRNANFSYANFSSGDIIKIFVNATNSAGLTTMSTSNITTDLDSPSNVVIASDLNDGELSNRWYNQPHAYFNFSSNDSLSGIKGYSYTLSTDYSISPDDVPEGDENNLSNSTNKNFTALSTGKYKFKIKAKDVAGNIGEIETYNVWIDVTAPSKPEITSSSKVFAENKINFVWSESFDENSNISYYEIEIWNNSDYNETLSIAYNTTNSSILNYEFTPLDNYLTYYARVRALDNASNPSIWSNQASEYDTSSPRIIGAQTLNIDSLTSPIIFFSTSKTSTCYYINSLGNFSRFQYTNSTYHETKPNDAQTPFTVNCSDEYGNYNTTSISFTTESGLTSVDALTLPSIIYSGNIVKFNVSVSLNKGQLSKDKFKLYINGTNTDFTVDDKGNGEYVLSFIPQTNGEYVLAVEVEGTLSSETPFSAVSLSLVASYQENGLTFTNYEDRFTYSNISNMQIGFTSDSNNILIDSLNDELKMSSQNNGRLYFFATKKIQNINTKNQLLKNDAFLSQRIPSFGYAQSFLNTIKSTIKYQNIQISGNETLNAGSHTLIIKKVENSNNKKNVLVSTKISNYNKQGVEKYD